MKNCPFFIKVQSNIKLFNLQDWPQRPVTVFSLRNLGLGAAMAHMHTPLILPAGVVFGGSEALVWYE